jgi:hypothetical protein
LLPGQLGSPATARIEWPGVGAARVEPVSGNRVICFATAAVVCAVAAFAAVVSYSHIYGLGRAHGQDGTAARLLPLSVDGLILAALLVLLHEARNGRDAPAAGPAHAAARHRCDDRCVGCGRDAAEPAGYGRVVRPVPPQSEPAHHQRQC